MRTDFIPAAVTDGRWPMKAAAGYAMAALLLWLFLRHTEWPTLADAFQSAAWPLIGAAILLRLASLVVAALRWQALLEPTTHVPLGTVIAATFIGMTATVVAPMQAAELVRPYVLSSQSKVSYGTALASAVAEWFLDAFAILALFIPALVRLHAPGGRGLWFGAAIVLGLSLGGLALLGTLPRRAAGLERWIQGRHRWSSGMRDRVAAGVRSFVDGLRTLDRSRELVPVVVYSVLLAALMAMSAWLALRAFDLPLSVAAGFVLLGLITVAGMIPTPGAIGGFHAIVQVGLVTLFGIERGHTVLPVIAMHAVLYVPGALLGTVCFLAWPARLERRTT